MSNVGWFASDAPLLLAHGRHAGSSEGSNRPVLITAEHRTRHLYCIGSSGSGKSRFARHIVRQDIQHNRGFTKIDSQDLVREVLAEIAEVALGPGWPTSDRILELGDKLVLIEPCEQRFGVPGINLLQAANDQTGYQLVDSIIEVIRQTWSDCFGPRLEDICRHGLLLLQELGLSFAEMLPLLSSAEFRRELVSRSTNPDLRLYFDEHLGGLRASELKTWVESSRNKISSFVSNPYVRPLIGQLRSTIDFRDVLDSGRWLLINLSRDRLKQSRHPLGSLMVALIHNAAISRENMPPSERIAHSLIIDEFQEYFAEPMIHILEAGRKYGLALSLFHQNLTQPPFDREEGVIDTILANAHTLVVFGVGRPDADRLARELFFSDGSAVKMQRSFIGIPVERPQFWPLSEEREHFSSELMKQRRGEAVIRLKGIGDDRPYFAKIPPVADVEIRQEKIDLLRQHVASRYCRPVDEVNREIDDRWAAIMRSARPARPGTTDFTR